MLIRTFVFEDDQHIRTLVSQVSAKRGHEVLGFAEPSLCPIYAGTGCSCPQEEACGDILIADIQMPRMSGLELIEKQLRGGCRGSVRSKAVMSAGFTAEELARAAALGCRIFRKPFRLRELDAWLADCERRIPVGRRLVQLGALSSSDGEAATSR
jgi:DNA-binding response OmpR family regulator